MTLRQRSPRIEEPAHLRYVRTQPCLICGRLPADAAHLRSAAQRYGKRATGMGEKPDDKWTVPLCRRDHMAQHAYGDELGWWLRHGVPDPFAIAMRLHQAGPSRGVSPSPRLVRSSLLKPRKSRKVAQRADPSWPVGRKIPSRKRDTSLALQIIRENAGETS